MDHAPLLAPVQPIIAAADLAVCHMETPIAWPGDRFGFRGRASIGGYTLIAAPYELAGDLRRIGFDRCSTASNHSWDLGEDGVASTLAALDGAELSHVGTARTPAESGTRLAPFEVHGVRVAHLSYTQTSNTGFPRNAWLVDRGVDASTMAADVAAARDDGAEVVVVSWHVIAQMTTAPLPDDRAFVAELLELADVDLVLIHGPHTVQPLEVVRGTPVFWSLGNVMSGMGVPGRDEFSDPRALDGLLAAVRFTERPDGTFVADAAPVLLCQMAGSRVVHPGIAALDSPATPPSEVDDVGACIDRSGGRRRRPASVELAVGEHPGCRGPRRRGGAPGRGAGTARTSRR